MKLDLPPYHELQRYEGTGNYAIWKYYQWPYRIFYRKKLKMILSLITKTPDCRILDFGAGPGIFTKTLQAVGVVKSIDFRDTIDPRWKFDLIICGSVLEFVDLKPALHTLKFMTKPGSEIIVASPMKTWLSRLYFKSIKDTKSRHSHEVIIEEMSKVFHVETVKKWFGLYFALRARCKT